MGTIPPEKKVNNAYLKSIKGKISINQKANKPTMKFNIESSKYPNNAEKKNRRSLDGLTEIEILYMKIDITTIGNVLANI